MRVRIGDWLVHGGHQYEFFKLKHLFICTNPDGTKPSYNALGRPKNNDVIYVDKKTFLRQNFDIIMVRAGVDYSHMNRVALKSKIPGIAVMQTYLPYAIPTWTRAVVWNSKVVMDRHKHNFPKQKHFYIPHGFDPDEFVNLGTSKNGRILSAASLFEKRKKVMGFDEWRAVADETGLCDLLGHGNNSISEAIGSYPLEGLVRKYNEYSVFLNTTTKSAMPRVRAEALMCGTPLVTTKNFGIERYLKHNKSCLYADTKDDMIKACRSILSSNSLSEDLSLAGREAAIKYFNIKDYLDKWTYVIEEVAR